ncbi:MAG TPA: hypothetical protein VE821_12930 [Pyrinomonadaceae bacterium]|nr:hypothetical protein [Pyrinomonadaceae bacterium]
MRAPVCASVPGRANVVGRRWSRAELRPASVARLAGHLPQRSVQGQDQFGQLLSIRLHLRLLLCEHGGGDITTQLVGD